MLKKLCLFAIALLLSCTIFAQNNYTVKGKVIDTASLMNLGYTAITAINKSDSILQDYTRADEDGNFSLKLQQPGDYILIYAHPTFANLISEITVKNAVEDLGEVQLISKINILKEVMITDTRAITIKGDTTEYAADSFKVREFATVDELLKKLPGIEVDQKGKITAHGEKVQKMLVDGDEFFADDPAVLAKMLRASAVDKVQVYDKKSEEAEFTGIDDGSKIKTINLKLKDNAKQGYFGKVELGGGLPKYYENQLMLNAFKDKRKIAAYAIMSNTYKVGLGWEDNMKYGGGGNIRFGGDEDGGVDMGTMIYTESSDNDFGGFGGNYSGEGLPKTINGGLHYGNKFGKKDNVNFNADYRVNSNGLNAINSSRTQYTMPDTQYINNSASNMKTSNMLNALSSYTEVTIDSSSTFTARIGGSVNTSKNNRTTTSDYSRMDGTKINDSKSTTDNTSNTQKANIDLNYRKKLAKKGRSFSTGITGDFSNTQSDGSLVSTNTFFLTGTQRDFNQRKQDSNVNLSGKIRLAYTEPLYKEKIFLVTNAYSEYTKTTSSRYTFDRVPGTTTDTFNPLYSSSYGYALWTNAVGANLRFVLKNVKFYFGGNVANSNLRQTNNFTDSTINRNYINFFPSASIQYSKKRMNSYSLRYNGSTRQPSINQIQPMAVNTDPLNITIGNPNLVQEFNHRFSFNINNYKVLSERYIYIGGGVNITQNALSQKRTITSNGVSTYQTVNLNGNWNGYVWGGYSTKIKALDLTLNLNLNANYNHSNSILNERKNYSDNWSLRPELSFYYDKDTTWNISYSFSPSYNQNKTSINTSAATSYYQINQTLETSYKFKNNLELGTNLDWRIRQKIDKMDKNNNVFIMNAYISKSFLKDRSLVLRVEGNDLFNQNIGFSRSSYENYITERNYNNIRRYFMLKLAWNFTYSKAKAKGNAKEESAETELFEMD